MPTYDFICTACDHRFERLTGRNDATPACEACGAPTKRAMSPGAGFIIKTPTDGDGPRSCHGPKDGPCRFDTSGTTCCGKQQKCNHDH